MMLKVLDGSDGSKKYKTRNKVTNVCYKALQLHYIYSRAPL